MPKIVVKRKAETYKEFLIQPYKSRITIGSEGDNDLIISDKNVSPYHFIIKKEGNQYFIEDLGSESGTLLNRKKVKGKTKIINGDKITVGEHSLIFENALFEDDNTDRNRPHTQNNILELKPAKHLKATNSESKKNQPPSSTERTSDQKTIEQEKTKNHEIPEEKSKNIFPHSLLAISGPYLGKKYPLKFGKTKIGRDQILNDIVIRETSAGEIDTSISRRHATVFFEDGNFFVTDKRSKTRTWVNQRQLDEDDMIQLSPNDEIQIVSDQKSTIFRFVETGKENFSRPKKAGFCWDRNANRLAKFFSFLLAATLFILIIISFNNIKLINQNLGTLKLKKQPLFTGENDQIIFLNREEVLKNAAALSPAVADLNGDDFLDIIFLDKIGYLHVINGKTYQPLWKNNFVHRAQLPVGITVADINNNNLPDIIIPANNSVIYAIDGISGNEIWASPILGGSFSGNPVVTDLNGDKLPDIFICSQSGQLHIGFSGFDNPDWTTLQVNAKISCPPSAADVNNDGLPEIFFGSEQGMVFIYDGTQRQITNSINVNEQLQKAKETIYENHSIRQRIAAGKLNDDPFNDIVILTESNHLLAFDIHNKNRFWYDKLKTEQDSGTTSAPTIGDLNGDKKMEVVVVTQDKIVAYEGSGSGAGLKKINWAHLPENQEQFVSLPVLADINKDQKNDVIVANYNGEINIFDGANGELLNELVPAISDSLAVIGTPLVADLNKNGRLDILLRRNDDSFYILETNSLVKQGAVLWGQLNFNALQNGCQRLFKNLKLIYYAILLTSVFILLLLLIINLHVAVKRRRLIKKKSTGLSE